MDLDSDSEGSNLRFFDAESTRSAELPDMHDDCNDVDFEGMQVRSSSSEDGDRTQGMTLDSDSAAEPEAAGNHLRKSGWERKKTPHGSRAHMRAFGSCSQPQSLQLATARRV